MKPTPTRYRVVITDDSIGIQPGGDLTFAEATAEAQGFTDRVLARARIIDAAKRERDTIFLQQGIKGL